MTALTFGLIGWFYDQTHTRMLDDLGGLMKTMPFVGTCFVIACMASAGLPGFANFVSELLVIVGAWQSTTLFTKIPAILAVWGLVITGVYLLRAVKDIWYGEAKARWKDLVDAKRPHERLPYVILVAALVLFGFVPQPMLSVIAQGTDPLVRRWEQAAPEPTTGRVPAAPAEVPHDQRPPGSPPPAAPPERR
jgi:NADH-quinone oxidoreductase subunit M